MVRDWWRSSLNPPTRCVHTWSNQWYFSRHLPKAWRFSQRLGVPKQWSCNFGGFQGCMSYGWRYWCPCRWSGGLLGRLWRSCQRRGFHKMPEEDLHTARPRHPRHAAHGLKGTAMPSIHDTWEDDLPTEELIAKSKKDADGIWFKPDHSMGWIVYARKSTFKLTAPYMDAHPIDSEFNVWYRTYMSPGWMPCGGKCAANRPPRWWKVDDHPPPFNNRELVRLKCRGFCRMARSQQSKEWDLKGTRFGYLQVTLFDLTSRFVSLSMPSE